MRLCDANLGELSNTVRVPRYDRKALTPGIVHIGLGNFHRAHQAWYLHRLFDQGLNHDWAIIGAGVRPGDALQRERLLAQDCLTTLIELNSDGSSNAEIVGSMIDFVPVEEGNAPLVAQMSDPAIRIVAMTITEGGYFIDPVTRAFAADDPDILHDAANPDRPRTAFGAIVAALARRRADGLAPFSIQSCDNLLGNGRIARQTVVGLARLSNLQLAEWIDAEVAFPNAMVDCIVPATGQKELAFANAMGIDDNAPVTHENFRQWVIEDEFCAGRPEWDKVGAMFSDRVHAFEAMKIRMLNAGHQIVANAGEILSIETIAGCMENPSIRAMFKKVMSEEIAPEVEPVPGMTPSAYLDLLMRRFSNPSIIDTTRRVAFDGSSRHAGFLLPTLRERLEAGKAVEGLALVEALWARMCEGSREDGTIIAPNDPNWEALNATAKIARERPGAWLEQEQIYGTIAQNAPFRDAFTRWLELIWQKGTAPTIDMWLGKAT